MRQRAWVGNEDVLVVGRRKHGRMAIGVVHVPWRLGRRWIAETLRRQDVQDQARIRWAHVQSARLGVN